LVFAIHDNERLPTAAGDACVNRRRADAVKRALLASVLLGSLAGCKEPQGANDPVAGFVRPGTGVAIQTVREVSPSDAVGLSNDEYYVVRFTWTNDVGYPLVPRIDHFVIEDRDRRRFLGADSGNPALVGIANYAGSLKTGESHVYTVGFRVPQNTVGTLYYDATL